MFHTINMPTLHPPAVHPPDGSQALKPTLALLGRSLSSLTAMLNVLDYTQVNSQNLVVGNNFFADLSRFASLPHLKESKHGSSTVHSSFKRNLVCRDFRPASPGLSSSPCGLAGDRWKPGRARPRGPRRPADRAAPRPAGGRRRSAGASKPQRRQSIAE